MVFSALFGYLLAVATPLIFEIILLVFGGLFVTGSANAFNQIIERNQDKLMKRTEIRPLPSNNLSVLESSVFAFIIGIIGIFFLCCINLQCAFFGLVSLLVYVLLYTPLKKISPIAIFIGAFPGAIPCLLGWVAATNDFGLAAGVLFAIQFCWQFPHFIAISWLLNNQYQKAGFKMMIGECNKKFSISAFIALVFSIMMTVISITPYFFLIQGLQLSYEFGIAIFIGGLLFSLITFQLFINGEGYTARRILITSYIYLPLIQILYILDKYLI